MPSLSCQAGDEVYVRAIVLTACSDAFQVRIEDFPSHAVTVWVPTSEVAKVEDIGRLKPLRRPNLAVEESEKVGLPSSVNSPAITVA